MVTWRLPGSFADKTGYLMMEVTDKKPDFLIMEVADKRPHKLGYLCRCNCFSGLLEFES